VVLVIILPFTLLLLSLTNELIAVYHLVQEKVKSGDLQASWQKMAQNPTIQWVLLKLGQNTDISSLNPLDFLIRNLQQISNFLFSQSTKILKGLSGFVIGFFFTLLSLYYLFKDGDHFVERLKKTIPIPAKQRDLLIERFRHMVRATIYGGLLIALIQGLIGGIAFWVLGLHSPVLWGTAMAFFSFIPLGGTAFIWVPASIFLFIKGSVVQGIILLIIGVFGISMVDNFLRPHFISSRTNIHPLLLFFAVLGGIQAFGLVGVVLGPLVATLCLTLIEIYTEETNT
jgi:predicted PurR-regulated permease PerM